MQKAPQPGYELREQFWVEEHLPKTPPHPQEASEKFYGGIVRVARAMMRWQRLQVVVEGAENLPPQGGAVLAINHTGFFDFVYAGVSAQVRGRRLVRFMAKKEIFDVPGVGAIMRAMGHIPVDRTAGTAALNAAIEEVRAGKLLGIFPEGTISRSFEVASQLRTGAVRIAQGADVPLIPVAIWGSQRVWTKDIPRNIGRSGTPIWIRVGQPIDPASLCEDPVVATAHLRQVLHQNVATVRAEYDDAFGPFPPGERWIPESMGGAAPSPAEAEARAAAEREQRLQKKAERLEKQQAKAARKKSWWTKLKR